MSCSAAFFYNVEKAGLSNKETFPDLFSLKDTDRSGCWLSSLCPQKLQTEGPAWEPLTTRPSGLTTPCASLVFSKLGGAGLV